MEPSQFGPTTTNVSGTTSSISQNIVSDQSRLPPHSRTSHSKRRLATTRGFRNISPSRGSSYLITPNNSPLSEFRPGAKSTPSCDILQYPAINNVNLPIDQTLSPGVIHFNPSHQPVVGQPLRGIETSVISPRISVQEASLDWDHFGTELTSQNTNVEGQNNTAEFFGDIQGISGLEDIRKVTLVDTSVSSLSSDNMAVHNGYDAEAQLRVLRNMVEAVEDMIQDFTPADVRKGNIGEVPKLLEDISKARADFRNSVREYKQYYNPGQSNTVYLDNAVKALNDSVRNHAHTIWAKVEEVQGLSNSSSTVRNRIDSNTRGDNLRDDVEYKQNLYRDQLLYLRESLYLPDEEDTIEAHWKQKSESEVSNVMHEINNWQKVVERLSRVFREYERTVQLSGQDSDSTFVSDSEDFENIRNKLKEVVLAVKLEDQERNLQSLLPSKSEKVKYPTFAGEPGEDLLKFKEKITECFRKNRVPQSDMLDKLRENLKGVALKRVPETVRDLNIAWQNLTEAFGSPMTVLKERLKSLTKLGNIPSDSFPAKQITWYHDFESVLQDVIDLGTTDDMNLQMGAYGPPVQEQILRALSDNPMKKREVAKAGHGKQPRDKLLAFRDKIIEFRRDTQLAEVESGATHEKKSSKPSIPTNTVNVTDSLRYADCRV